MSQVQTTGQKAPARLRIYGCGGGGSNITHKFEGQRGQPQPGFATMFPCYIDTSRANLNELGGISEDDLYILKVINLAGDEEESEGSGGVRAENFEDINKDLGNILEKFPPLEYNIIISTCAGGSGSVFAPLLASALLERDANFVVLGMGDTASFIRLENTEKTLKSYDTVAKMHEKPILMSYLENSLELPREKVNKIHELTVSSLALLFSGQNGELDSRDVANWQYFNRPGVTSWPARLVSLHILDSREEGWKDLGDICTVLTLTTREIGTKLPVFADYQKDGFLTTNIESITQAGEPMHFASAHGPIVVTIKRLEERSKKVREQREKRKNERDVSTEADKPNKAGLVL